MAAPANKAFYDEIESRLKNIKETNGYNFTIHDDSINRAKLTPFNGYDLPAVNFWVDNMVSEPTEYGIDNRYLNLYIHMYSKTVDEPFIDVCDRMAQDLVNALNRATTAPTVGGEINIDLGGLVDDLSFLGYEYQVGEGQEPFFAILANFLVKFTTDTNTM